MRKARVGMLWVAAALAVSPAATGQERLTAVRGGEVHTISQGVIRGGAVVFQGGKIVDVTSGDVPSDAELIDASGLVVTPGIIDARSGLGVSPSDSWETSGAVTPQLRIFESFTLPANHDWLRAGVTAVYVSPGPQAVIGGLGAVVKLAGRRASQLVREDAGMSASLGEIPKQSFEAAAPKTRMGAIWLLRQALIDAGEYRAAQGSGREVDLGLAALARVLAGELPLRVQANTPDDIMNALRVAEEFGIRAVIDVAVGAHRVASSLAAAGVPVVVGPSMIGAGGGGRYEFASHTEENAARLHEAGVQIALSTDSRGGRSVVVEAIVAKAHGLPEAAALAAITRNAAEILGVSSRLGSLEKGKDADLVLWDRHPLNTWAMTRKVIVDGRVVFDRGDE